MRTIKEQIYTLERDLEILKRSIIHDELTEEQVNVRLVKRMLKDMYIGFYDILSVSTTEVKVLIKGYYTVGAHIPTDWYIVCHVNTHDTMIVVFRKR